MVQIFAILHISPAAAHDDNQIHVGNLCDILLVNILSLFTTF